MAKQVKLIAFKSGPSDYEYFEFDNGWIATFEPTDDFGASGWQWVIKINDEENEDLYPDTFDEMICMMQIEDNCIVIGIDGQPIDGKLSIKETGHPNDPKFQ